jgi:choice-of-anchor A domain-containing protein
MPGIGVSGAGILIVHGNLNIKNDMSYQSSNVSSDLRRLASLTVVVYGNLTIENNVRNIVGAYYVDGTINTATDEPTYNTVVVRGLMIAKDFAFKRGTRDAEHRARHDHPRKKPCVRGSLIDAFPYG